MENTNKELLGGYFATDANSALSGVTETSGTEMDSSFNFTPPYQGHPLNNSTELVPAFNFPSSYQTHPITNPGFSYPSILDGSPIVQPISYQEVREQKFLQACKMQQQQQQQLLVAANSQMMLKASHPSVLNNSDSDTSAQMHKKPRLELIHNAIYNREVIRRSQAMMHHMLHEKQVQVQLQKMQQQSYPAIDNVPSLIHCNSGICSRRLMQYMYHLRLRPTDNNILYWRKFVAEYYAPCAKKRWCFSLYDHVGPHVVGVFPQNAWLCGICGSKSGRGLEAFFEVLPRLKKINFESGLKDELLYLDVPQEYKHPSGLLVLEYGRAVHESVYEQLRVVRQGKLRVIFTNELKILSWEFCSRNHEELISRRSVAPEVNHLILAALKQQSFARGSRSGGILPKDLEANCQMFAVAGRQLAKTLESQLVDGLGFSKRFVRCLQISEVVNSLKDLMTSSMHNNIGPIESLQNYAQDATSIAKNNPMLEKEQLIADHKSSDGKESPSSSSEDAASYNLLKQRISNMDMSMAARPKQEPSRLSFSVNNEASSSSLKSSSTQMGSGLSSSQSSSGDQNLQQYTILQEMMNSSNLGNFPTTASIARLQGPACRIGSSAASATVLRGSAVGTTGSFKDSSSGSNYLARNSGSFMKREPSSPGFIKREPSSPEENQLPEVISDVSLEMCENEGFYPDENINFG